MPTITSVEVQKRNTKRFNIFIDGEFAFGADEDLVVEHRLIPGKIIDSQDVEKLLFEVEVGKLMERMYRLWNVRARSEKEVRVYLKNLSFKRKVKGQEEISDGAAELLISKLKQKRLLSDEEFARAWVEARRKTKTKGKVALKQELFQKGIDREIIEEILEQTTSEEEEQLAQQALERKMKIWKSLPVLDLKKKAYELLMRKGFEYEVVKDVVEKAVKLM